jgi:hypothetical protein
MGNPPASAIGFLNTEMRYITHHAANGRDGFGAEYGSASANDATNKTAFRHAHRD